MMILVVIAAVLGLTSAALEDQEFDAWKLKFGKSYESLEEIHRKMIWLENRKLVLAHNELADRGLSSFRLGMTYFADMSIEEYRKVVVGGYRRLSDRTTKAHGNATYFPPPPNSVDWRKKGYVTAVKNQKQCRSCWAFSAAGALEGQMFRKTGKLVPLSEQQLVDCSRSYKNKGCSGGHMNRAFKYIKVNKGLDTEVSYPYKAEDGQCRFNPKTVGATCTGFVSITSRDERALQQAVATIGPVSAAIDCRHRSFQLYESGVYDEPACNSRNLSHCVLVVGYGTKGRDDYWLVKNSWGKDWGMEGYIMMSRNKKNQCGIANRASYPLV